MSGPAIGTRFLLVPHPDCPRSTDHDKADGRPQPAPTTQNARLRSWTMPLRLTFSWGGFVRFPVRSLPLLFALVGWPASAVAQTHWVLVSLPGPGDVVQVDSSRFVAAKPIYRSWAKIIYEHPRVIQPDTVPAANALWRIEVNCETKQIRVPQIIMYDTTGNLLQDLDSTKIGAVAWSSPTPDSYAEVVIVDFCRAIPLFDGEWAREFQNYQKATAIADTLTSTLCQREKRTDVLAWCATWRAGDPPLPSPATRAALEVWRTRTEKWSYAQAALDAAYNIERPRYPTYPLLRK